MKIAVSLFAFCLFAVFSVTVKNQLRKAKSPLEALTIGQQMPAFTLPDQKGVPVKFTEGPQTAKLTMINFWATWCVPCRMEMPQFEKLHAARQKDGLLILAVNEDEKLSDLDAYLKAKPVSFPVLVDTDGTLAKQFGIRAFPTTILVDGDGRILRVIEGLEPYLEFQIDGYLALKNRDGKPVRTNDAHGLFKDKEGK
jgi:cytochrome c biogenesis protein CcmG/thiol:disulfide interchange protein DsbE